jgi:hypothetical protein
MIVRDEAGNQLYDYRQLPEGIYWQQPQEANNGVQYTLNLQLSDRENQLFIHYTCDDLLLCAGIPSNSYDLT